MHQLNQLNQPKGVVRLSAPDNAAAWATIEHALGTVSRNRLLPSSNTKPRHYHLGRAPGMPLMQLAGATGRCCASTVREQPCCSTSQPVLVWPPSGRRQRAPHAAGGPAAQQGSHVAGAAWVALGFYVVLHPLDVAGMKVAPVAAGCARSNPHHPAIGMLAERVPFCAAAATQLPAFGCCREISALCSAVTALPHHQHVA